VLDSIMSPAVAIGDVTGDGRADVVVLAQNLGGPTLDQIVVYPQLATGQLGAPLSYPLLDSYQGDAGIALGDLNGDGRLDVAATSTDAVAVLYQDATGRLGPAQALALPSGVEPETVSIADFDGDGRSDVAAAGFQTGLLVWYQRAGHLGLPSTFECSVDWPSVSAVADFDGDGRLDIALGGGQAPVGCLVLQQPTGFGPAIVVNDAEVSIAAGDLNGDGRAELITVGESYPSPPEANIGVANLANDGATMGAFAWTQDAESIPSAVVLADVDGDQRLDAVVVHVGETIGVYLQQPDGTFSVEKEFTEPFIGYGVNRLAVGDINSDGRPDIVVVEYNLHILLHR
jgi:hypothetical protein